MASLSFPVAEGGLPSLNELRLLYFLYAAPKRGPKSDGVSEFAKESDETSTSHKYAR